MVLFGVFMATVSMVFQTSLEIFARIDPRGTAAGGLFSRGVYTAGLLDRLLCFEL